MLDTKQYRKLFNYNTIRVIPKPKKLSTWFNLDKNPLRQHTFDIKTIISHIFSLSHIPKNPILPSKYQLISFKLNNKQKRSLSIKDMSLQSLIKSRNSKGINRTKMQNSKPSLSSKDIYSSSPPHKIQSRHHLTPLMQKYCFFEKRDKELRSNASHLEIRNNTLNKLGNQYNFYQPRSKVFSRKEIFDSDPKDYVKNDPMN